MARPVLLSGALVAVPLGLILEAAPGDEEAVRRTLATLLAQAHRDWRLALHWRGPAPAGFPGDPRITADPLPDGVAISTRASGVPELTIWFVTRRKELEGDIARVSVAMGQGLWIAWPKKSSALAVDVTEDVVRNAGLAHGLVDYKVCAIDPTWSGLAFKRRR